MARMSKAAFSAYYKELPDDLKALRMFFGAATNYHQVHSNEARATFQERRWARSVIEARVFCAIDPGPVMRRCERILSADREVRLARIRERRRPRAAEVLRLDLNAGLGAVVPFKKRSRLGSQNAASA